MLQLAAGYRNSIISFDRALSPGYRQVSAQKGEWKRSNYCFRILSKIKRMASDSFPPENLKEIANEVAALLKERKETIAVAETVRLLSFPFFDHDLIAITIQSIF